MDEPDFGIKLLSNNGINVTQYSGKDDFILGIYPGCKKMNVTLHSHTYYFIHWIKKGEGVHTINFEDIPIKDNQIFFIAPGEIHKVLYTNDNFDDVAILFSEELLNLLPQNVSNWIRFNLFNSFRKPSVATIDAEMAEDLDMWISRLKFFLTENRDRYIDYCCAAMLSVILLQLKNHASWNKELQNYDYHKLEIFCKLRRSISRNLKTSHSLAFYSIDVGVAESKLTVMTKELYGLSPRKLINEEIIIKAKQLLALNELNIKEITEELGFTDSPHFVKFFKKETGLTPGQFRENVAL